MGGKAFIKELAHAIMEVKSFVRPPGTWRPRETDYLAQSENQRSLQFNCQAEAKGLTALRIPVLSHRVQSFAGKQ